MKKLFFLLTFSIFCATALVTQAFAAPAQNSRQGGGASTKRVATQKAGSNAKATQKTSSQRATTRTGSKATQQRATTNKAAAQRKTQSAQASTKTQERAQMRNQEFGLMPSEIDATNHAVFHADANAIKGAREAEQAFRYLPFVTIVNTAGFGSSFDLRGQGRLSSNGVKMYINGVGVNPVDGYNTPMPMATLLPQLIQEVSVTPGGGAVLYGSGAKGGTINVITSQRTAPYFLVGAGYVNTMASKGNSFNAFAQAAENLGAHLKVNAGLGISVLGGPREDDASQNAQAVVGAWYDIGWGQSVSVDVDAFYNKTQTTPYNSLIDFGNINQFMLNEISLPAVIQGVVDAGYNSQNVFEQNRYQCLAGNASACAYGANDFEPDKGDRADKGYGDIEKTQLRATGKVGWESQLTQKLKLNVDGFYSLSSIKFDKYQMNLPYFVLGYVNPQNKSQKGYNWFLPRPNSPVRPDLPAEGYFVWAEDGQRADWHFLDQTGSTFDEHKFGVNAKIDWTHDNGQLLFGMDFTYEMNKKNSKSYLRQAIVDGSVFGGYVPAVPAIKYSSEQFSSLQANIIDKTDINVLTTAAYVYETYNLNRNFSVGAGMRYEMKNYDVKMADEFEGSKWRFNNTADTTNCGNGNCDYVNYDSGRKLDIKKMERDANGNITGNVSNETWADGIATAEAKGEYNKNHDNFTFELAPVFKYSNTGAIYARGELGYIAPPAWAMLRRIGIVWGASKQSEIRWDTTSSPAQGINTPATGGVLDFDFDFETQDLKNETYYTAELGWKEMIGSRRVPLGITNLTINALLFNASLFYTASQNEFYFEGDTWSGMSFGNYSKSRRFGVELAAEQYLFGGALGINESFTYLKAQKMDCAAPNPQTGECPAGEAWSPVPYTYDWKATLGAAVNISTFLEVIDVDVSVWLQNSIYGNQNIYTTTLNVVNRGNSNNQEPVFYGTREDKKLSPYLVSDFGVSVGINKNMGVVTVGIKNLFDTFYYDYYNNDKSAVVNENRYVIGRGRTVFVEGTFRY